MVQLIRHPQVKTETETRRKKVVAAIPCLNTQNTIGDIVKLAKEYVNEVIVIDDGSTDLTAIVAQVAGAVVLRHDRNRGKGAAMKTAAAHIDADIIVFIDGDGQHDPSDIPALLKPILEAKADFVIGSRFLSGSKTSYVPVGRKATNVLASVVISFIISFLQPVVGLLNRKSAFKPKFSSPFSLSLHRLNQSQQRNKARSNYLKREKLQPLADNYRLLNSGFKWVSDCTSGFTAMRLDNWRKLNLASDGYQIETEIIFEQAKNGFIIAETPISCDWKGSLSRLSIIKDGVKTLLLLARKFVDHPQ
jgi:glycosyltransferase involved in cell wall biosynthesis